MRSGERNEEEVQDKRNKLKKVDPGHARNSETKSL